MILLKVATTSCAVTGWPSQKVAFWRSVKVYVLPPSVGAGTSRARSPTKSVEEGGASGFTRMSVL